MILAIDGVTDLVIIPGPVIIPGLVITPDGVPQMMIMGLGNHQVLFYTHQCQMEIPILRLPKKDIGGQGIQGTA